jgi:hypothetical protein
MKRFVTLLIVASLMLCTACTEHEMPAGQSEADKKEITGTMNIVTSMKDTLKDDGMASEDWESIKNSGFEWGEEGTIEFADFINMSYKEQ